MKRTLRLTALATMVAALLVIVPASASANSAAAPSALNFANQTVGTTSPPQPVVVTTTCSVSFMGGCLIQGAFLALPGFSGPNASDFSQTNVGNVFQVTFTPTAPGPRTAIFNTGSDLTGSSPGPVALTGTATAAIVPPTGQRAAALAKCKNKHSKKKRKKCRNKANLLPV